MKKCIVLVFISYFIFQFTFSCPATGHLGTSFSWFPSVYKRMLRWFPSFQVATTCLSCSPPDLNFLVTYLMKRLQRYGHFKRMPEDRVPKLIMEWIPLERRKRGRPRETWIDVVQAAMTTRSLEPDQWRNREEWRLVSGRRRQLL